MLKSILKIIQFISSITPTAIELLNSRVENKKIDNLIDFIKAIEKRLDDIYLNVLDKLKKILLWILIVYLTQIFVIILLIILLFRSCSAK